MQTIENPRIRVVEDMKIRNRDNMKIVAGEYFGSKFTYGETSWYTQHYKWIWNDRNRKCFWNVNT